ncbi:Restriction endonuclease S subunit [Streptococcus sp. DD10]|uniref:restriction endonuclease subunit S n=1 Tax=Streptococcus sp. DD10 TaxID=1777878 RepID=UPI000794DA06|nr:restriction endonuclease subunit S [Streptococcus sp. DD10]KXT72957.1 Restriction endonuclease S subunit [Streptococcus sp. DD10]
MKKIQLGDLVTFQVGFPQFRVKERPNGHRYKIYNQLDLEDDLAGVSHKERESKELTTTDPLTQLRNGDLVFSLISGTAAIVSKEHEGYFYTQNYVVLEPSKELDKNFLLYLLNEDKAVKRQFLLGLQGSAVLKYTVKQLRELQLPRLESLERQRLIGMVYRKQEEVKALKIRQAEREYLLRMGELEEVRKV